MLFALIQSLFQELFSILGFCRHEWILERQQGQMMRRCMHCLRVQPDPMTALIRSDVPSDKVEPVLQTDFPPPLYPSKRFLPR
jgi:hypothetical protein